MTPEGRRPFRKWYDSLSPEALNAVDVRIKRVRDGNPGDVKPEGEGVSELRIHSGQGLRIYFGQDGKRIVLLLSGGDKSSQERDIQRAKEYWKDYKQRSRKGERPEAPEWNG